MLTFLPEIKGKQAFVIIIDRHSRTGFGWIDSNFDRLLIHLVFFLSMIDRKKKKETVFFIFRDYIHFSLYHRHNASLLYIDCDMRHHVHRLDCLYVLSSCVVLL
jgi:hypothetical protein